MTMTFPRTEVLNVLDMKERDRRWNNIRKTMEGRNLDALIVWGTSAFLRELSGNLQYLTNTGTEGALLFPLAAEPTLWTFEGGFESTWVPDWRAGQPKYSQLMSEKMKELHLENARIGIVGLGGYYTEIGFPYNMYINLMNNFPKAKFEDATDIVEDARRIKSEAEIRCMETAGEVMTKVHQAIVDTARPGVKEYEVKAAIMDTMYRNGCDPCIMLLYCQGKGPLLHAGQNGWYFDPPSQKVLEPDDIILTEIHCNYLGYLGEANQPFSVGEPNEEWQKIFNLAVDALNNGLSVLKAGITVGELDQAFNNPIFEAGHIIANPPFHGLGLSLEMPMGSYPRQTTYEPDLSFPIQENMVLSVEPHPITKDFQKSIHVGSPVLVTKTGYRFLTKGWKPEFKVTGK